MAYHKSFYNFIILFFNFTFLVVYHDINESTPYVSSLIIEFLIFEFFIYYNNDKKSKL